MSFRKLSSLILWGIHLLLIIIINFVSTYTSYNEFYYKKKGDNAISIGLQSLITSRPVYYYAEFSGIEAGYGFFAPNVASEILLELTYTDQKGRQIKVNAPSFKNKESFLRYISGLSVFLDYVDITKIQDSTNVHFLEAATKCIAKGIIPITKSSNIKIKVFIYNFPSLIRYANGFKKPELFLLREFDYDHD